MKSAKSTTTESKEEKWEIDENAPIIILNSVKKTLQDLYNHYRSIESRCEYLTNENERLKSEAYKDEELAKMKESYDKMKSCYYLGFPISEKEDKKIKEWQDKIIGNGPMMKINSARFHYEFYPTPLGTVGYVVDELSGEKFKFQDIG